MAQYRKKPVVVEAYQTSEDMDIYTLEGVMHASAGDYIICLLYTSDAADE